MAKAYSKMDLDAPAGKAWDILKGFNNMPSWHPAFSESNFDSGSNSRVMVLADGSPLIEALEAFDNDAMMLRYSITETQLPITSYLGTVRVTETADDSCAVEWFSDFEAEAGKTGEMKEALEGVYEAGFAALRERIAG